MQKLILFYGAVLAISWLVIYYFRQNTEMSEARWENKALLCSKSAQTLRRFTWEKGRDAEMCSPGNIRKFAIVDEMTKLVDTIFQVQQPAELQARILKFEKFIQEDSLEIKSGGPFWVSQFLPQLNAVFKSGSNAQKRYYLALLQLHSAILLKRISEEILKTVDYPADELFTGIMPCLSVNDVPIRAGQVMRCEVYALSYATNDSLLRFYIQNKNIPVSHGVGISSEVFHRPGNYNRALNCSVKDSVCSNSDYKKTFTVNISQ